MTQSRLLRERARNIRDPVPGTVALFSGRWSVYDNIAFPSCRQTHPIFTEGGRSPRIVSERPRRRGAGQKPATRLPNELSGGMRQGAAGFRGRRRLVLEPDVVMFDEPDSGLDPVRTALLCNPDSQDARALRRHVHRDHPQTRQPYGPPLGEYIAVLWEGAIVPGPGVGTRCSRRRTPFGPAQFLGRRRGRAPSAWSEAPGALTLEDRTFLPKRGMGSLLTAALTVSPPSPRVHPRAKLKQREGRYPLCTTT